MPGFRGVQVGLCGSRWRSCGSLRIWDDAVVFLVKSFGFGASGCRLGDLGKMRMSMAR